MRQPSGKVSLGTLILFAAIAGAVYMAVMVVPFYVDNFDVKEAVAVAHNLAGRNNPDAILRSTIRQRTSQMGNHWERDQFDRAYLAPGLGLTDDQIFIERSEVTQNVRIEVRYDRVVRLKPTDRTYTLHFSVVKEGIPGQ